MVEARGSESEQRRRVGHGDTFLGDWTSVMVAMAALFPSFIS